MTDAATVVYQTENNGDVEYTNFILANGKYGIDWYTLSEAGAIGANKAYLSLPTASLSNAAGFQWVYEGETTSVASPKSSPEGKDFSPLLLEVTGEAWYTLDGRKLTQHPTQKGVYIHGNKKIVIK